MRKKPAFVSEQIYHIYNRGVAKGNIFQEEGDYFRFIHNLFEFNDENPVAPANIRFSLRQPSTAQIPQFIQCLEIGSLNIKRPSRKLLVDILAFCLMPNHFHLLIRQRKEKGISAFMQKMGIGYTMSFNQKYERVGPLFQGSFKAVLVEKDIHFLYLPFYIHANPLELMVSGWKEKGIDDTASMIQFLESYRWSSYSDYIGKNNFPSVTQREPLLKLLLNPSPREIKQQTEEWIKGFSSDNYESFKELAID